MAEPKIPISLAAACSELTRDTLSVSDDAFGRVHQNHEVRPSLPHFQGLVVHEQPMNTGRGQLSPNVLEFVGTQFDRLGAESQGHLRHGQSASWSYSHSPVWNDEAERYHIPTNSFEGSVPTPEANKGIMSTMMGTTQEATVACGPSNLETAQFVEDTRSECGDDWSNNGVNYYPTFRSWQMPQTPWLGSVNFDGHNMQREGSVSAHPQSHTRSSGASAEPSFEYNWLVAAPIQSPSYSVTPCRNMKQSAAQRPAGPIDLKFDATHFRQDFKSYPAVADLPSLPEGISWKEICQKFPNHLWGNILLQYIELGGWTEQQIWECCPVDGRHNRQPNRPWNYLQQRVRRARDVLHRRQPGPSNPNKGRRKRKPVESKACMDGPHGSDNDGGHEPTGQSVQSRSDHISGLSEIEAEVECGERSQSSPLASLPLATSPSLPTSTVNSGFDQRCSIQQDAATGSGSFSRERNYADRLESVRTVVQQFRIETQELRQAVQQEQILQYRTLREILSLDPCTNSLSDREQDELAHKRLALASDRWENQMELINGTRVNTQNDHVHPLKLLYWRMYLAQSNLRELGQEWMRAAVEKHSWKNYLEEMRRWTQDWEKKRNQLCQGQGTSGEVSTLALPQSTSLHRNLSQGDVSHDKSRANESEEIITDAALTRQPVEIPNNSAPALPQYDHPLELQLTADSDIFGDRVASTGQQAEVYHSQLQGVNVEEFQSFKSIQMPRSQNQRKRRKTRFQEFSLD